MLLKKEKNKVFLVHWFLMYQGIQKRSYYKNF